MRGNVYIQQPTNWFGVFLKALAIVALVGFTNFGFFDRFELLYASQRWFTLAFYLAMWGTSFGALLIAAFQPNKICASGVGGIALNICNCCLYVHQRFRFRFIGI